MYMHVCLCMVARCTCTCLHITHVLHFSVKCIAHLCAAQAKTGFNSWASTTTIIGAASSHPTKAWPMPLRAAPGLLKIRSLMASGAASSLGALMTNSPNLMNGKMHATCHTTGRSDTCLPSTTTLALLTAAGASNLAVAEALHSLSPQQGQKPDLLEEALEDADECHSTSAQNGAQMPALCSHLQ